MPCSMWKQTFKKKSRKLITLQQLYYYLYNNLKFVWTLWGILPPVLLNEGRNTINLVFNLKIKKEKL